MADEEMRDAAAGSGAPAPAKAADKSLANSDLLTKYREAASIANTVLAEVIAFLAPGKEISEVCAFGDAAIEAATGKVYTKKVKGSTIDKGVAFPTCISVNETVAHYSPLKGESKLLFAGDAVKIDLGVHLDGCIALVAHTTVLRAEPLEPLSGPQANVIAAAHAAAEVAVRLIKPGNKNTQVTEAIEQVAAAFGVNAVAGVESSQLLPFQLDAGTTIPTKRDPAVKYEEKEFKANEVYAIEIAFTTGEGKARESEARTTVYSRKVDVNYQLKMKASRALLAEVNKTHPTLPFSLRSLTLEPKDVRLGVGEAQKYGCLAAFPVLEERDGAKTAHFRFTVLLLPGGTLKVTGQDLPEWIVPTATLTGSLAEIRASVPYVKPPKKEKAVAAAADVEMAAA